LPLLALALCGFSEEKNGVQVSVAKATLSKADQHGAMNTDTLDRTQGLKVTVTNTSFKDVPEGEVDWEILVRKHNSTRIESYTGSEKLKALHKSESVDLTIGAVPILGYHDGAYLEIDKIEWHIAVKRGGLELLSASSIPGFANLAKRAEPGTTLKGK
jgi:hypothetical protein